MEELIKYLKNVLKINSNGLNIIHYLLCKQNMDPCEYLNYLKKQIKEENPSSIDQNNKIIDFNKYKLKN